MHSEATQFHHELHITVQPISKQQSSISHHDMAVPSENTMNSSSVGWRNALHVLRGWVLWVDKTNTVANYPVDHLHLQWTQQNYQRVVVYIYIYIYIYIHIHLSIYTIYHTYIYVYNIGVTSTIFATYFVRIVATWSTTMLNHFWLTSLKYDRFPRAPYHLKCIYSEVVSDVTKFTQNHVRNHRQNGKKYIIDALYLHYICIYMHMIMFTCLTVLNAPHSSNSGKTLYR